MFLVAVNVAHKELPEQTFDTFSSFKDYYEVKYECLQKCFVEKVT